MRPLTLILTLILCTSPAHAGSYTVTTTPEQDEALTVLSAKYAARRSPTQAQPPPMTNQQMIQHVVDSYTAVTVRDLKGAADRKAACAKLDAQHKAALGCEPSQ